MSGTCRRQQSRPASAQSWIEAHPAFAGMQEAWRPISTCTTMTETECATTSCSSRAIRTRSRATASRSRSARSPSSCSVRARSSAVRRARPRPTRPSAQHPGEEHDGEDHVAGRSVGPECRDDDDQREAHRRIRPAPGGGAGAPRWRTRGSRRGSRWTRGPRDAAPASPSPTAATATAPSAASGAVLRHAIAPGQDRAQQQRRHERRFAHGRERHLELDEHAEGRRQREVEAPRPREPHVAGSSMGSRARSSKPAGRRRSARSSPP